MGQFFSCVGAMARPATNFFSCVGTRARLAAKMPWVYFFGKMIKYKVKGTIYFLHAVILKYFVKMHLL